VVLGLDTQLESFITFENGEYFTPDEPGIIINQGMADMGGYSVGDTLTLTSAGEAEYPITGIFELPPMLQQADRAEEIPADFAAMFWQDLAQLEGKSLEGEPLPQGYFVITTLDDPSVDDLDNIIDDIDQVMLTSGISVLNFNFVALVEQISEIFTTIQIILQLVAGLIAVVGALGLLTTLSMSVFERQKEIGVMRSIGAGSITVAGQFLTEGIVVGVISWVVGLPLAALIQLLLLNVTGFDETFPFVFSLEAAIIGFVGMIVITTIASIWPSLGAARKTVSDILRYQ
jgi:ABC-type antimicrobial peptide transport system permease subunit